MKSKKRDNFDYLISMASEDLVCKNSEWYENIDNSEVEMSRKTDRKIKKLFRIEHRKRVSPEYNVLSKAAIIVMVIMSIMFTSMMSVSAIREAVWEIITEWYDEYFSVKYEPTDETVVPPTMIEEIRKPSWLPIQTEEMVLINEQDMYFCVYNVDDMCILTFRQRLLGDDVVDFDGTDIKIEHKIINGYHVMITVGENNSFIWSDGEYSFDMISGYFSVEEMCKILEYIK